MILKLLIIQWYEKKFTGRDVDYDCKWISYNWYEISSLVEQRLCEGASKSDIASIFLPASLSSWSAAVTSQRESATWQSRLKKKFRFDQYDSPVLKIISSYYRQIKD